MCTADGNVFQYFADYVEKHSHPKWCPLAAETKKTKKSNILDIDPDEDLTIESDEMDIDPDEDLIIESDENDSE
jgi:hypothetical protein